MVDSIRSGRSLAMVFGEEKENGLQIMERADEKSLSTRVES
jgi:hypothetical protein